MVKTLFRPRELSYLRGKLISLWTKNIIHYDTLYKCVHYIEVKRLYDGQSNHVHKCSKKV